METGAGPEHHSASDERRQVALAVKAQLRQPARKLSEELDGLIMEFKTETVTIREMMVVLHGRGYVLLLLLLALPFAVPIPLPGLSTLFGFVIALIALRLVLGQKPWLPARMLDRPLSAKMFTRIVSGARRVMRFFEILLRPRLTWMTGSPLLLQLHAVPILLCSLVLLLPLPIPFSNVIPSLVILVISAGLLERDGLFILVGYVLFFAIGWVTFESVDLIREWIVKWLEGRASPV